MQQQWDVTENSPPKKRTKLKILENSRPKTHKLVDLLRNNHEQKRSKINYKIRKHKKFL